MRTVLYLCVLVAVLGCAAPRQATSGQPTPVESPVRASATLARESRVPMSVWKAGERRLELRLVDPATGQKSLDHPPISAGWPFTFTADRTKLAIHEPRDN